MQKLEVFGSNKLKGTIDISGSKNASLPILAASLLTNKKIRRFKLFTSIDTWGKRAEYIRDGLDINVFERNLDYFMKNTTEINERKFQIGKLMLR